MKMNDIINAIRDLASSQGFYGRLLNAIYELDDEQFNELKIELENQNFKDVVDMVLYFEC